MPYLHHITAVNTINTDDLSSVHTQEPGAMSDAACKARKATGEHKHFESAPLRDCNYYSRTAADSKHSMTLSRRRQEARARAERTRP